VAVGVAAVLGLATSAAPALASTVGQTGTPSNSYYFGGDEIVSTTYAVPAGGGLITSFQTQASSCQLQYYGFVQGSYDFQALRPEGGNQYLVLGDAGNQTDPCDSQLHSYSAHIDVQSGDVLGVYIVSNWVGVLSGSGFSDQFDYQSEPSVGQIITAPNTDLSSNGLDESATLVSTAQLAAQLVSDSATILGGHSLYEQALAIQTAVKNGQTATACSEIGTYITSVQRSGLPAATMAKLTGDATTLAGALGCI